MAESNINAGVGVLRSENATHTELDDIEYYTDISNIG